MPPRSAKQLAKMTPNKNLRAIVIALIMLFSNHPIQCHKVIHLNKELLDHLFFAGVKLR